MKNNILNEGAIPMNQTSSGSSRKRTDYDSGHQTTTEITRKNQNEFVRNARTVNTEMNEQFNVGQKYSPFTCTFTNEKNVRPIHDTLRFYKKIDDFNH